MKNEDLGQEVASLRKMANSENWHIREEAGFTLRNLVEDHFADVYPMIKDWTTDASENVRRASCLACMQRKAKSTPDRIKKVLKYLDILMKDDSLYVRKCCGPFVVGYLGYTYPDIVIPWLKRKAASRDLNVKANVAKAFSQALAKNYSKEGIEILEMLAEDERTRVRSAVISAGKNILKLNPTVKLKGTMAALLISKRK
jgi:3-methyladenine DNA glycosylase AlkC